jgi:hypothetical protein
LIGVREQPCLTWCRTNNRAGRHGTLNRKGSGHSARPRVPARRSSKAPRQPAARRHAANARDQEPATIFDTFATDDARTAHIDGQIPAALANVSADLLASTPDIRPVDVVAVK